MCQHPAAVQGRRARPQAEARHAAAAKPHHPHRHHHGRGAKPPRQGLHRLRAVATRCEQQHQATLPSGRRASSPTCGSAGKQPRGGRGRGRGETPQVERGATTTATTPTSTAATAADAWETLGPEPRLGRRGAFHDTLPASAPGRRNTGGSCDAVAGGTRGMSLIIRRYIVLYVSPSGSWGELWFYIQRK